MSLNLAFRDSLQADTILNELYSVVISNTVKHQVVYESCNGCCHITPLTLRGNSC